MATIETKALYLGSEKIIVNATDVECFKKFGYTEKGEGDDPITEANTVDEIKAYAAEKGIELTGAKTKAEMLAIIAKA